MFLAFRLLLATLLAAFICGPIVVLIGAVLNLLPLGGPWAGYFLSLTMPYAVVFGGIAALIPATVLGGLLYFGARMWHGLRPAWFWAFSGAICGFFLVGLIGPPDPLADLPASVTAAVTGATSMLAYRFVMSGVWPKKRYIETKNTPAIQLALVAVVLAVSGYLLSMDREYRSVVLDKSRFVRSGIKKPRTITLYRYSTEHDGKTDGSHITLLVRETGYDGENIVSDRAKFHFEHEDIREAGGNPEAFVGAENYVSASVAIDRTDNVEQIRKFATRIEKRLKAGGRTMPETVDCPIFWSGPLVGDFVDPHDLPEQFDPAVGRIKGVGRSASGQDDAEFNCVAERCVVSSAYHGHRLQVRLKSASVCDWKDQRAAIRALLDDRIVERSGPGF